MDHMASHLHKRAEFNITQCVQLCDAMFVFAD